MKLCLALLLCFLTPAAWSLADEPDSVNQLDSVDRLDSVNRLDRVVGIESRVPSQPNTGKLCSAFLVRVDSRLFIVTAGHASAETNAESRIRYRDSTGESQWVTIKSLVPPSSNPWHRDPTSDFAIAELHSREGNEVYISHLTELSIPLESLCTETPRRATAVVTIGFPLGIGVRPDVSPLAVVGHVASRETLAESSWGQEPIVFSSPALAQGTSGGPTFLLSESQGSTSQGSTEVVGMYVGIVHDSSGAKLSKMVPAHLIRDCIAEFAKDEDEDEPSECTDVTKSSLF